jgi:uncharacterized membrane protein
LIGLSELITINSTNPFYWILGGIRLLMGIPFVLYVPGYLLQGLFFPLQSDLDSVERVGLSLGLSVALVSLLALLINALPWGLRPWPIIIGQLSLIVVLMVVTAIVRRLMPVGQVYSPQVRPRLSLWWKDLGTSEKRVMVVMAGALLFAVITAAWIFLKPSSDKFMTEFYMLGQEGLAEDYPREIIAGQVVTITTGITNREGVTSTYHLQVKLGDQVIGQASPITLENNATWEQPVEFSIPIVGDDQQAMFILDREGKPSPYRTLRLWIKVTPTETP